MIAIKTLAQYLVEQQQCLRCIFTQQAVGNIKIVVVIQNVQVINYRTIGYLPTGKTDNLIEHR